jgi:hypothetical protein
MKIEQIVHDDDDRLEHEVRIGVVGVEQPLTVIIESDFYEWPRIKDYQTYGGIDLPMKMLDCLVFRCFELLLPTMGDNDFGEETLPDATRWIEVQFLTSEAETILAALRRHVTPGLYVDELGRRVQ